MKTADFDYFLPESLIAQVPSEKRGASRMLVHELAADRNTVTFFTEIEHWLQAGDLLVLNDTKVINARLYGRKGGTLEGAATEFLLLSPLTSDFTVWQAYAKPAKRIPPGTRVRLVSHDGSFTEPEAWAETLQKCDDGSVHIRLETAGNVFDFLEKHGHLPLPPYIGREPDENDKARYQTVFAAHPGAVAAPTAGLHFTDDILNLLRSKGVETVDVTLHTGAGTFKPVTVEDVSQHVMHRERYEITAAAAEKINAAKREGRRIIAVGTTSVRTLESAADAQGYVMAGSRDTAIFLYPPYQLKCVNGLLTNFHLPKSTLLMLISTFSSREKILSAYQLAIQESFRFYSYGDCMLIL